MRVSSKHNFIFLSNTRCASTSIDAVLQEYSAFGHEHCNDPINAKMYCADEMKTYFDFMNENDEETWEWSDYYKFTTIRNPFTRWVSAYFFHAPDKDGVGTFSENYDINSKFGIGFNLWLEQIIESGAGLPNYDWFCLDHNTKECLVDKVIKVENIESEFPEFMKEQFDVDIPNLPKLDYNMQQANKDPIVDPYSLYNKKGREIIEQVYESDISLFNYEFGQ